MASVFDATRFLETGAFTSPTSKPWMKPKQVCHGPETDRRRRKMPE